MTKADAAGGGPPQCASDADATYRRLEELIVLTELKPGVMYSEKELAALVGYGRTPVREALQRLEAEGLVSVLQRRGIRITEADSDTQLRLLEIRRPLQNFVAEYAAIRATASDRRTMHRFGLELHAAGKTAPASRAEALAGMRRAHDLVLDACHNEFAVKTMRMVQGLSRRFWVFHMRRRDFAIAAGLHSRLLLAVADRDVSAAVAASDALMDYLERFARRVKDWE